MWVIFEFIYLYEPQLESGVGQGSDSEREREGDNPENQTVFISRAVKSEFFHCPEIISVFLKKITRSTESSPL